MYYINVALLLYTRYWAILLNFEQILSISRRWVVRQVMINRALVLMGIIEKYGYIQDISLNKQNQITFKINKKLSIILLDASWIQYGRQKETCLFNRRNFTMILDGIKDE